MSRFQLFRQAPRIFTAPIVHFTVCSESKCTVDETITPSRAQQSVLAIRPSKPIRNPHSELQRFRRWLKQSWKQRPSSVSQHSPDRGPGSELQRMTIHSMLRTCGRALRGSLGGQCRVTSTMELAVSLVRREDGRRGVVDGMMPRAAVLPSGSSELALPRRSKFGCLRVQRSGRSWTCSPIRPGRIE